MDGTRFDTAAKALARGVSRRSVLRGMLGGILGVTIARAPVGAACTAPGPLAYCNSDADCCDVSVCLLGICQCPTGKKACGERCIDTALTCGPTYCPAGYKTCGTTCIDTTRDRNNCGGCGRVCPALQNCTNSHCCPKGYVFCNGTCKISTQCTLIT